MSMSAKGVESPLLVNMRILKDAGNAKALNGRKRSRMNKESRLDGSINLHGDNGSYMSINTTYDKKISVYDNRPDWIKNPLFNGLLSELVTRLQNDALMVAEIVTLKKQIRDMEEEISILKDNQVHEPVH